MAEEKRVRGSGVVKRFLSGYGFIKVHGDDDRDLFVHHSEVKSDGRHSTLYPDDEVEFDIVFDGDGRMMAGDVTRPGGGAFDYSRRPRRGNGRGSVSRNKGDKCNRCGGVGHWARECPSPLQPRNFAKDGDARGRTRACYSCGDGRVFYTWQQTGEQETRNCYTCSKIGHIN